MARHRLLMALALALSLSLLLPFQIASAQGAGANLTIGVLLKTTANPYWGAMKDGIIAAGEDLGVALVVQSVTSEQATEEQLNTLVNMLNWDLDGLVVAAINSVNLLPGLKQASDRGIPIADLDANLDPEILANEGIDIAFAISSNHRLAGASAADYMVERFGRNASGKVLVIEGIAGNVTSIERTGGFKDRLREIAPNLRVVASLPADWDRLKAANVAMDVVQAHPDLLAVFAANDTMALGAVESLRSLGHDQVFVVGTDGNRDAIEAIRNGRLNASVAQLPFLVGYRAVENLVKLARGEQVPERIYVPTFVVDAEVLEAGVSAQPLLEYVR